MSLFADGGEIITIPAGLTWFAFPGVAVYGAIFNSCKFIHTNPPGHFSNGVSAGNWVSRSDAAVG